MNDLAHVDDLVEHQDRGADLTIAHPVTGERMPDIVLTIAGPDSDTARRARIRFSDELMAFRNRPPADELERMEVERLARLVVGWKVTRDGKPVEFSFTNVVRLLTSAQFVREQVETFSQNRAPYFMRTL
jgi:hypothetical protein